jgi:ABC-2 type transport system ATP-binding protein
MSVTSVFAEPYAAAPSRPVGARGPAVRIDGLTKRFAVRSGLGSMLRPRSFATVVDRVTFDVEAGEVFGILGPNGAGKTTIFKMLSTMISPDEGTATIIGCDVRAHRAEVRRVLGVVSSDERSLNWRLSARENLLLFAALHRVPRAAAGTRTAELLALVGLESAGRKLVAEFSSGMRQRLLIARALLSSPRVLLLDEPTRALDPISAQEFRTFLRNELVDGQRCTILLATHNTDEALGFCDRIAVLNRGRVLATGTALELSERFGEERCRIFTTEPQHRCLAALERGGVIRRLNSELRVPADGWHVVECAFAGGSATSASVLRELLDSGVPVARLERVEPSLADLIGRIIAASGAPGSHA